MSKYNINTETTYNTNNFEKAMVMATIKCILYQIKLELLRYDTTRNKRSK